MLLQHRLLPTHRLLMRLHRLVSAENTALEAAAPPAAAAVGPAGQHALERLLFACRLHARRCKRRAGAATAAGHRRTLKSLNETRAYTDCEPLHRMHAARSVRPRALVATACVNSAISHLNTL